MDIKRITSGLLGFPLVLAVLLIGNKIVVDIALAIIALLAMSEYFNAVEKVSKPVRWLGYVSCFSIAFIHTSRKFKYGSNISCTNNINNTICTSNCNRYED